MPELHGWAGQEVAGMEHAETGVLGDARYALLDLRLRLRLVLQNTAKCSQLLRARS
jgi:hypothetical protein